MKARIIPLYFEPGRDQDFDRQLQVLTRLLGDIADFLPPMPLGAALAEADAVVFPQLLGESYRRVPDFKAIDLPILIVTSEFGTLSMWDWEIITYLRMHGVETVAPYNLQQTRQVCAALRVKRELRGAKLLVFQDNPGEGAQASIFKRFYWWEDECSARMLEKFGVTVVKKSYRELAAQAKSIPDAQAQAVWQKKAVPVDADVDSRALNSALKLYLALKRELDEDPAICGVGSNCLNESHFCDTTPCLAWNLFYQERQLTWGCEADTLAMLSLHILRKSLGVPIMMTNLYPFLLGDAAIKHERIKNFPEVSGDPADHVLVAHCGYMGVIPQAFAEKWQLRKKVLRIVDDNATAIDACLPTGPVTLAKLFPTLDRLSVVEGVLKGYAQYPDSDCRNGGVIQVADGRKLMDDLISHHYLILTGYQSANIRMLAKVFDLQIA